MENLIIDEVGEFLSLIKKKEGTAVAVNSMFTIAVVNALWMIIAGQRYDHDDAERSHILTQTNEYAYKCKIRNN